MIGSAGQKRRLNELDALRGIGALLVVNFHYATRFHELFPSAHHVPFHLFGGNYRVLLFFAISGFAIFFSFARLKSATDFVAGRAIRLLPAYWVAMILTLVIEHIGHMTSLYVSPLATIANITMLEQFFFLPAVDGAYWTLTVEIAFYFCMLMLWLICRMRNMEALILGWLVLKLIFALVWPDMPERIVMILILRYLPFFAIGMVSYRVWAGARSWRQQLPVLAAIVITVAVSETHDLIAVALILIASFWAMLAGYLRWLCVAPLLWFGQISYSLYLVHQHIGFTIMFNMDAAGYSPVVAYAAAVAAAVGLGALLHYGVERPAGRSLSALWKKAQAKGAPAAAPAAPAPPPINQPVDQN